MTTTWRSHCHETAVVVFFSSEMECLGSWAPWTSRSVDTTWWAGWAIEKVGRIKFNSLLLQRSPLDLAELERLIHRAETQFGSLRVEEATPALASR